jgi:hypothetical protein
MIRNAQTGDLPQLIKLARRLKAKSPYADVPDDVLTFGNTLGQCINNAFGLALVAVHDGEITGFMLAAAVPLWFSKKRAASDIVTYAESPRDGLRMIRKFIRWAWAIPNVIEVTMAQSSGIDIERSGKIYERMGLVRVGAIYTAVREDPDVEVAA